MLGRRVLGTAVALAAALSLVACVPSPAPPTPTPTQLTDAEAYAAAEEAFRAYIDALNQIDVADPETFEPAFALTTGELNAFDRRQYSTWHADGWATSGDLVIQSVEPAATDPADGAAGLQVCLDASSVSLTDREGESRTDPSRRDVAPVDVTVERSTEADGWLVSQIVLSGGRSC